MKKYVRYLLVFFVLFYSINCVKGATTEEFTAQIDALLSHIQFLQQQLDGYHGMSDELATNLTIRMLCNQPVTMLLPLTAQRVPFIRFQVMAPCCSDATISRFMIEERGIANKALESAMLLDSNGFQYGESKKFSNGRFVIFDSKIHLEAGEILTLIVAGNRTCLASGLGGQTTRLVLVAADASRECQIGVVSYGDKALFRPTTHTINETLQIGSYSLARSRPSTESDKSEIGCNWRTSPMIITSGSMERLYVKSIRWKKVGSIDYSDLDNVSTVVSDSDDEPVRYEAISSDDGAYFTTIFPHKGILIEKGSSKAFYVAGRAIGGLGRVIDFDVYNQSDIYVVGGTYNYGVAASSSVDVSPFYDGKPILVVDTQY